MEVITKFRCESIGGVSIKILKSALQKFIRRNEIDNALDIISMVLLCTEKRIVSNFVNRMVVMISEEISVNNLYAPIEFEKYLKKYYDGDNNVLYIMCIYLLNCKKYRLISDYKTVYNLKPYYLNDIIKLKELHCNLLKNNNMSDISELYDYTFNENDTFNKIIEYIKIKDTKSVFKLISYAMLKNFKLCILWNLLIKNATDDIINVIKSLKYIYTKMTHKEKPIYLYHAILLFLVDINHEKLILNFSIQRILDSQSRINNNIIINFEKYDYINDIHCGNKNKTEVDFANDGALIINECLYYANVQYRKMYIEFKEIISNFKTSINEDCKILKNEDILLITNCIKGQKRTNFSKPFVYIPTDIHNKYVWKGPYLKNCKKILMFKFRTEIFKKWNSKYILGDIYTEENTDNVWIKSPLFGDVKNIQYTIETDLNGDKIKILNRESINSDKLSYKNLNIQKDVFYGDYFLIRDFIHGCILKCGDFGFWNVLISNDHTAFIIDYEETRVNNCLGFDYLFTKNIKNQTELLSCIKLSTVKKKIIEILVNIKLDIDYLDEKIHYYNVSKFINIEYIKKTIECLENDLNLK